MKHTLERARVSIAASLLLSACSHPSHPHTQLSAPQGHWISLINGKNLDGWTVKIAGQDLNDNYRNTFRVENGSLMVSYQDYDKFGDRFGSIYYNSKFSHYWLHAEYRFLGSQASGAPSWAYENSGIQLHSQSPESMLKDQKFPVSVEFDIVGDRLLSNHPTGDVCQNGTLVKIQGVQLTGQCSKLSDIKIKGEEWVTVEAEVNGAADVKQIVNGALVVEYTDIRLDDSNPDARRLLDAGADKKLSSGYVSIQANSHPIEFRRIDVMPIEP